jgi:hypothetical protein
MNNPAGASGSKTQPNVPPVYAATDNRYPAFGSGSPQYVNDPQYAGQPNQQPQYQPQYNQQQPNSRPQTQPTEGYANGLNTGSFISGNPGNMNSTANPRLASANNSNGTQEGAFSVNRATERGSFNTNADNAKTEKGSNNFGGASTNSTSQASPGDNANQANTGPSRKSQPNSKNSGSTDSEEAETGKPWGVLVAISLLLLLSLVFNCFLTYLHYESRIRYRSLLSRVHGDVPESSLR